MTDENPFASWTERFHEFIAEFLRTKYELPVKEVTDVSTRNEDWQLGTYTGPMADESHFASWTERFHEFVAEFLRTKYELPVKEVTDVSTRNEDWQLGTYTGGTDYYTDVSWTDTDGKNHFNSYSGTPSEFFRD